MPVKLYSVLLSKLCVIVQKSIYRVVFAEVYYFSFWQSAYIFLQILLNGSQVALICKLFQCKHRLLEILSSLQELLVSTP